MVFSDASVCLTVLFVNRLQKKKNLLVEFQRSLLSKRRGLVIGWVELSGLRGWPFALSPKKEHSAERGGIIWVWGFSPKRREPCSLCHTQTVATGPGCDMPQPSLSRWENLLRRMEKGPHPRPPASTWTLIAAVGDCHHEDREGEAGTGSPAGQGQAGGWFATVKSFAVLGRRLDSN